MNVSVGKFFKKLIGRKQSAPTKVVRQVAPQLEKSEARDPESHHMAGINAHNNHQAMRAGKRKRERVKNKMRKANRKANRKGGRS